MVISLLVGVSWAGSWPYSTMSYLKAEVAHVAGLVGA